jgi:leader peptidase (prepilin peptidase) / N-methyltransferase
VDPFIATLVFLFGLAFGSFLNVCIHRLPREKSVVAPGSACPECGHEIRWYDNVPVLSWLVLRARCRDCGTAISPRYMVVELLVAALFLFCYAQFGLTVVTLKYCILCFLLTGLIFTDAETKLLPDALTLPGLVIGLVLSFFVPVQDVLSYFLPNLTARSALAESWRLLSFSDAVLGAIVGASFIYGSGMAYKLARGVEGMGFGDVKLMAMVGAFLGLKLTLFTIFGGSILGAFFGLSAIPAVWVKRTRRRMTRQKEPRAIAQKRAWDSAKKVYRYYAMPFGVFLGSMALVAAFFGNAIFTWYLRRVM